MKRLMLAVVIALAVVGGAVVVSTAIHPAVADGCDSPNC
jgi:hypothetical protein